MTDKFLAEPSLPLMVKALESIAESLKVLSEQKPKTSGKPAPAITYQKPTGIIERLFWGK